MSKRPLYCISKSSLPKGESIVGRRPIGPVSWRGDLDGDDLQPVFAAMAVSPISCPIFKYYGSEPQLESYFLKCRLMSSFTLNFEIHR
ncbi:hypothetical protein A4A49_60655 [Nicotiana attenuata]|uniref:Uncharacterized protein n=1 Tax=Nicotiana attenuata TaxID=49451 RepID=A0A1J6HWG6_NICAT|nr:hypothetical protein A4A49_60655 [Nicotiana attenuata]